MSTADDTKSNTEYQCGDIVLISNLQSMAQYNGLFGEVINYISEKGRYHITLVSKDNKKRSLLIKPVNLSMIFSIKYDHKIMDHNKISRKFCFFCEKITEVCKILPCMQCRSIFYCSKKCLEKNASDHNIFCDSYKTFAKTEYKLLCKKDKLFDFDNILLYSDHMSQSSWLWWLTQMELLNQGLWKRLYDDGSIKFGEFNPNEIFDPFTYSINNLLIPTFAATDIVKSDIIIKTWKKYHKIKNISLASPFAHWMSYVMTIYYGLTQYVNSKPIIKVKEMKSIVIHMIGVEIEIDLLLLYKELLCLLPGYNFYIYMFGKNKNVSNKFLNKGKQMTYKIRKSGGFVRFNIFKTDYCERNVKYCIEKKEHYLADIVIGLNIGISHDFPGWFDAMKFINKYKIRSLFTEYFNSSIKRNELNFNRFLKVNMTRKYIVNPFGSPLTNFEMGGKLSSITNGFIFTIN
eukprot:165826_1